MSSANISPCCLPVQFQVTLQHKAKMCPLLVTEDLTDVPILLLIPPRGFSYHLLSHQIHLTCCRCPVTAPLLSSKERRSLRWHKMGQRINGNIHWSWDTSQETRPDNMQFCSCCRLPQTHDKEHRLMFIEYFADR